MNRSDYCRILGIRPEATEQEIKSAYRRLAREYHPDVNPEDHESEERFKQINQAYSALLNGGAKEVDGEGNVWSPWANQPAEPDTYFAWANAQDAAWAAQNSDMGFAELFQATYGQGNVHFSPIPDMDDAFARWQNNQTTQLPDFEITLEEAFSGVSKLSADGVRVDVPPGAYDGASVATSDGRSVQIRLAPHPTFQSNVLDLYCEISVHPDDARTGIPITLPTLYGNAEVTLPAGVANDEFLRLESLGLPGTLSGSASGHLFLHIIHDASLMQGTTGPVHPYRWGD